MKKTILFLFLSFVMIGCNDKKENISTESNRVNTEAIENCTEDMSGYTALIEVKDKVKWLKDNGSNVCRPILFPFLRNDHRLKPGEYDKKADKGQAKLTMRWSEIHDKIKGHFYDKYVGFKENSDGTLSMDTIAGFKEEGQSFSIPLLLSIADTLKLADDDTATTFEFARTKEADSPIIFKVNGYPDLEMNYSTKPSKKK